jgi:hypothetical protein
VLKDASLIHSMLERSFDSVSSHLQFRRQSGTYTVYVVQSEDKRSKGSKRTKEKGGPWV